MRVAVSESSRIVALTYRLWVTSINGINLPPWRFESGDLLAGDHALRRERDLVCTGRANFVGNVKAAADLEHRDDVAHWNAISQPEPGRSNVHSALRVIDG